MSEHQANSLCTCLLYAKEISFFACVSCLLTCCIFNFCVLCFVIWEHLHHCVIRARHLHHCVIDDLSWSEWSFCTYSHAREFMHCPPFLDTLSVKKCYTVAFYLPCDFDGALLLCFFDICWSFEH
jgi:hypothetical protein